MGPLSHVVVLFRRSRVPPAPTLQLVHTLSELGAKVRTPYEPCSDLPLLTNALICNALTQDSEREVLMLLDDDMVMRIDNAQRLCAFGEEDHPAQTALYIKRNGAVCGTRLSDRDPSDTSGRWLFGLGAMAVQAAALKSIMAERPELYYSTGDNNRFFAFCQSYARAGSWYADDYSLCDLLGGVELVPAVAGHIKPVPLWPDERDLALLLDGQRLPGERNDVLSVEQPKIEAAE